jgi:hypothetical protein
MSSTRPLGGDAFVSPLRIHGEAPRTRGSVGGGTPKSRCGALALTMWGLRPDIWPLGVGWPSKHCPLREKPPRRFSAWGGKAISCQKPCRRHELCLYLHPDLELVVRLIEEVRHILEEEHGHWVCSQMVEGMACSLAAGT